MVRRLLPVALAAARLAAQTPAADSAWRAGDFARARVLYEQALAADSNDARARHQIAILDSWDGRFERALAGLARLRQAAPGDPDLMVDEARVLSWANRLPDAAALYDTVLARDSTRADALAGRARVSAWGGDLERAEALWRGALALHPDDAEITVGLAQTLYWEGEPALAEDYVARARTLAPSDRAARELERQLRAELRPAVHTAVTGSGDSDHNDALVQDAWLDGSLGRGVRGTLRGGWRRATAPGVAAAASYGADGLALVNAGGALIRAGLGVRALAPDTGTARTLATAQLGVRVRPAPFATLALTYSRSAFDETVELIRRGIAVDGVDASVDIAPRARWSVSGGGGWAALSDGNHRSGGVAAILAGVAGGLQAGVYGRVLAYAHPRPGIYFAPDRFTVLEARAVYDWRRRDWSVRADGGVGTQQVGKSAASQSEWHAALAISREWWSNGALELAGLVTNSAVSSTTGAFRYRALTLTFRQGL